MLAKVELMGNKNIKVNHEKVGIKFSNSYSQKR